MVTSRTYLHLVILRSQCVGCNGITCPRVKQNYRLSYFITNYHHFCLLIAVVFYHYRASGEEFNWFHIKSLRHAFNAT